jgi:hypothetical protein
MTNMTHSSFSICLFQFSIRFEQPRAHHHKENQLCQYNICYMSLWPSSMQVGKGFPHLHARRSPTQSDTYQMFYWYNWFSLWWARGCSKHVENWNKRKEKGIFRQVGHLQELNRDARSRRRTCKNHIICCILTRYLSNKRSISGSLKWEVGVRYNTEHDL